MLQLVDDILSAVCKTVVLQEGKLDANYRYVCVTLSGIISYCSSPGG